jgi:hypothetical protein
MVALGELPMVDAAVHSDTQFERSETYEFAKQWTPWLEARGVRVVTVKPRKNSMVLFDDTGRTMLPLYTKDTNGNGGMLKRTCTNRWKIAPQRRWASDELARRGLKKTPGVIEKMLGITSDEAHRAKTNDVKYIVNKYPFLEDGCWLSRAAVVRWLKDHDLPIPVKSACLMCPYHSRAAWDEIKLSGSGDWQRALEIDEAIRNKRKRAGYTCYLVPELVPLEQICAQMSLWNDAPTLCGNVGCFL